MCKIMLVITFKQFDDFESASISADIIFELFGSWFRCRLIFILVGKIDRLIFLKKLKVSEYRRKGNRLA